MLNRIMIQAVILLTVSFAGVSAERFNPADSGALVKVVAAALHGDTVCLQNKIYTVENLLINKPLLLTGEPGSVLQSSGKGNILLIKSSNVTIAGLTFTGTAISFITDNAAIKAEQSDHITIKNCVLKNNFFGIYFSETANSNILNNSLSGFTGREANSGNGIHLWNSRNNVISGNTVSGHRDGIYLEFSKNAVIKYNRSTENLRYGLHFMFSDSCSYLANEFTHNGAGVAVMYSSQILMEKNRFAQNNGTTSYGLLLKDIKYSRITGNTIKENTIGIYMEAATGISVSGNTFYANGSALKVMANSTDNRFEGNDFTVNSFDVVSNSRQNFNTYDGNYWDTYSGYDLNKDGTGDVPHYPVKLFSVITAKYPASIILMRSLFSSLVDVTEKVFPAVTPKTLYDSRPRMRKNNDTNK